MMSTRSKSISTVLFVACFLLSVTILKAQDNYFNEPTFQAPNAASLGEYADVPIGYHTGVANISVPIYTVTEGELSLPISLSYHSGGIRVDEMASWVGLGWSLNAGGVISRSVQGGLDEGNTKPHAVSDLAGWGWYVDGGAPPVIMDPTATCYEPTRAQGGLVNINDDFSPGGSTSLGCWYYHADAARGKIDTEPDIFSYNVGGFAGKFFFDKNQNVVMMPVQDVKIDVVFSSATGKFVNWYITTPDGVRYIFGKTASTSDIDPIENTYTNSTGWPTNNEDFYSTSSWYLHRIESPNGRHWIELEYEEETYGFANRSSQSCQADASGTIIGDCDDASQILMKNRVEGVRIRRITTSSGACEAEFIKTAAPRQDVYAEADGPVNTAHALHQIKIDEKGISKLFTFHTSYFNSDPASIHTNTYDLSDTRRLRLDGIQESSSDGSVVLPARTFSYNTTQMARRYSLARDHWGFYNGVDTQTSLIPSEGLSISTWLPGPPGTAVVPGPIVNVNSQGGAHRESDETKMKAWILTQMKYKTGGYSKFSYEGHRDSNGNLIGGLRVKNVAEFDRNDQQLKEKVISYGDGRLYTQAGGYGIDVQYHQNSYVNHYPFVYFFGGLYQSTPNTALRHNNGYHIAYTSATVNFLDGSYQKFIYTNSNPIFDPNRLYPLRPPIHEIGNGSLFRSEERDELDNVISSSQNNYSASSFLNAASIVRLTELDLVNNTSPPNGVTSQVFKNIYEIRSSALRLQSVTETKDGFTSTTSYTYGNNHQQPIEQTTTNSLGEIVKVEYAYPPDLNSMQAYHLTNRNQINQPLEVDNYVDNNLISSTRLNFSVDGTIVNLSDVDQYPDGINRIRTSVTFDENDNLASVQKEYDIPVTYHWEGPQRISVGVFQGASPNQVYYTSFEESDLANVNSQLEAKTGKCYYDGTSVLLNSQDVPAPGTGMIISYYYFEDGKWKRREKAYDSYVISEAGASRYDEIRIHPQGSLVKSYQLGYGNQVISSSDENGNTITHTLDQLGRLFNVKDNQGFIQQQIEYNYANQN